MKMKSVGSKRRYYELLKDYIQQYQKQYDEEELEYLKKYFLSDCQEANSDILMQIYAKFEMLEQSENYYLGFAKMIGKKYGWDSHILEIGGGYYPIFSKYVDDFQRKNHACGTITTYDPSLVVSKLGNVRLHKKRFTSDLDVDAYDLLVGIMPCEASTLIVNKAIQAKKEFVVGMCGCTHSDFYLYQRCGSWLTFDQWVEYFYSLAQEQERDGFTVRMKLDNNFGFPYPIITSQKNR